MRLLRAQTRTGLSEAKVKDLIQRETLIQACEEPAYTFQSVQFGQIVRQKQYGQTFILHPVHLRYQVTCRYADDQVRAEVDMRLAYYTDPFGAWKMIDGALDGIQNWDDSESDTRCRVRTLAHLTLDKSGKVTGSTPPKDDGYIGCLVETKASD